MWPNATDAAEKGRVRRLLEKNAEENPLQEGTASQRTILSMATHVIYGHQEGIADDNRCHALRVLATLKGSKLDYQAVIKVTELAEEPSEERRVYALVDKRNGTYEVLPWEGGAPDAYEIHHILQQLKSDQNQETARRERSDVIDDASGSR